LSNHQYQEIMEKEGPTQEARQIENAVCEAVVEDAQDERAQPLTAKTVVLLMVCTYLGVALVAFLNLQQTIVSSYFAQLFHLVGSGYLARKIMATVGGQGDIVWITSILTISLVVLGPPMSQGADYWGRKWPVVVLGLFSTVGCIIVSRAKSIGMILAAQAIAGMAQASQPLLHAITSEIIARRHRPVAQIFNNIAAGLGGIVGLLVGGALTLHNIEGWRTYWYIAAAIYASSAAGAALLYNPPPRELQAHLSNTEKLRRLDWISYTLLLIGLTLFCVALSWSQNPYLWSNAHINAPFIVSIIALLMLGCYSHFVKKDGLFHHGLFSVNRNFALAEVAIFAEGMSFFASNNYFSFQMTELYGENQFRAALAYAVGFFSYIVCTTCAGIYCSKSRSVRFPLMVAFTLFTVYHVLIATTTVNTSKNPWGYIVILGLGLGIALNALIVVAQLSTPVDLISTASGLMISIRSLGGTVGLVIYNAVFNSVISSKLAENVFTAVMPFKLPPASAGSLIAALTAGEITVAEHIPGVTPQIIAAASLAIRETFALAFRNVWISAASFTFLLCAVRSHFLL
jgi:MFS family permease